MRFEGPSSAEQKRPEAARSSAEQRGLLTKLTEYGEELNMAVNRALEKAMQKMTGTDPSALDVDLTPEIPSIFNTSGNGRDFRPERDTPEARAKEAVATTRRNLQNAHGRLARALAFAGALAVGGAALVPAAERVGQAQGAIDATSNDRSREDSIGRFVRNVRDATKEVVDTASDHIEDELRQQRQQRQQETTPARTTESPEVTHNREANNAIKLHMGEIAKDLFEQWRTDTNKEGGHVLALEVYLSTHALDNLIKREPFFAPFNGNEFQLSHQLRTEISGQVLEARTAYLQHTFKNLRSGARLRDVENILRGVGFDGNDDLGAASAMLVEAGRVNLGMQLLRQTIREMRTDDGELLSLDAESGESEAPEEYTIGDEIVDDVIQPFLEQNPHLMAQLFGSERGRPQIRLTRDEMRLFLEASENLSDELNEDLELPIRGSARRGTESSNQEPPKTRNITVPNTMEAPPGVEGAANQTADYQRDIADYKDYETIRQRLDTVAQAQRSRDANRRNAGRPRGVQVATRSR